jgi:hypothetical protein
MARKRAKKRAKKRIIRKRPTKKRIAKKRAIKRRPAKKRVVLKPTAKKAKENIIGAVTHYFPQVRAAAIKLKAPLSLGERVRIKGHTTDFTQSVDSLQLDCKPISQGKRGQEIGLLVGSRVRRKDLVYKVLGAKQEVR